MEPAFPSDNPIDLSAVTDQIREIYGRVVWTHKTQEKCADILNEQHKVMKTGQVVLSALTVTSVVSRVFVGQEWVLSAAAILSLLQFGISAYLKEYDLGKVAQQHAESAADLLSIREAYFTLLVDIKVGRLTVEQIVERRDGLQTTMLNVYKNAPRSFPKAYKLASKALKNMEELTFSDAEIDKFLPIVLRKTS